MVSPEELKKAHKYLARSTFSSVINIRMEPSLKGFIEDKRIEYGYKSTSDFCRDILVSALDINAMA